MPSRGPGIQARFRGVPLDAADARRRPAAREVADRHRLGRRAGAPRRRRLAGRPDPPDGAVRDQRAPGAHQCIPPGARRLARASTHGPPQPLSAHARRRAPLRRRVSPHLRPAGRRLAGPVGARARGPRAAGAAPRAARGARVGGVRRARTRTFLRPHEAGPRAAVDPCRRCRPSAVIVVARATICRAASDRRGGGPRMGPRSRSRPTTAASLRASAR